MLVGRSGLSPVMVGRAAELDRLVGLIDARPDPSVALVAGEAGIGKTRLVQELVAHAPATALVLAGQADPGAESRPMELFRDALGSAATRDGAEAGGHAALLEAVDDAHRAADERVRAGVELVRRLAGGTAGVVVFEDLHWADSESLAVFEQLAEPGGGRLLVVGTYRPDGLTRRHPASGLLPRLERRHSITHIQLRRLSPADVNAFLTAVYGEVPSFPVVDALHTRTGGNPFFLEELVASAGDAPWRDLADMPLPWTVAELVRGQLDELDPEVRRLVTAASVLGRRVTFDVLAHVTGTPEDRLIDLLRAAVDSGLLAESEPDVFTFHHDLAREAIKEGQLGRERRRLQEAAFSALRALGSEDRLALALHARGAGRYEDMVAEARIGARESLARGSTYQARHLAEIALSEAEDDLELLALAARACWLAGLLDDAAAHCDRWLRLARDRDDVSQEAAALSLRKRIAREAGQIEAMVGFTDQLIAIIDRLSDEDRARAMAAIAQSYMLRDQIEATYEWADKAASLAETLDLTDVRLAAMVNKGTAMLNAGDRIDEGRRLLQTAADEAERIGDHVLAARALNYLVWDARQWSDAGEVREMIERAHRQAEAAGFELVAAIDLAANQAHLAAAEGDLDAAIAELDNARYTSAGNAVSWTDGRWLAVMRAGLALEAGDLDTAQRFTDMAKPPTERVAVGVFGLDFHLACRRGDLAEARSHLRVFADTVAHDGVAYPGQTHDVLAAALRAGLNTAEMRPLVDRVGLYVGHRLPPDDPWRQLIDAQVAEAEGSLEAAAGLYAAAAEGLESAPEVLAAHLGTAHVGAARTLVGEGRLDEARAHAEAAAPFLARWRGWRVDELRAVERRLGLGPEQSGPDALTPREREVVSLLAEGLTNSQVADRLYISPRTAAVHVSNILAKLGMSSRTEVAAWAVREGLGTP
jgi:DNA-binding CsgD family transcriptional regulator/tetratricopeptide (TPR) repeat protein